MSAELVQMVWMAQPPVTAGGKARVRKLPADCYWYTAQTFESHADALQWAYWRVYEDRTAEDRAWVARFTDFVPTDGGYTLAALQAARSHMSESFTIGNWRRGV